MRATDRPTPPPDFDENPARTKAGFAMATVGPHWSRRRAAEALRDAARVLRAQADKMGREADALAASRLAP